MPRPHRHRQGFSRLKWAAIGLVGMTGFVGVGFGRETLRSRQIDGQIDALRVESESLRARNFEIRSFQSSLSQGEFLEREARTKLGLQKEGEQVVVLKKEGQIPASDAGSVPQETWSNPKKWWIYFTDRKAFDAYVADTHH